MTVVLKVDSLSKVYRLGQTGTGTLKRDIYRWWAVKVKNRVDPFSVEFINHSHQKDTIWALKSVSFEVNQGEIVGIVGSNGSGKSTLLKILSRIVRPTSGTVMGKGKVNSLLEIGTGFNADLTGRENIFMSGYFLGMKKQEIQQRFDEIVEFSGVARFIDTPVKRYSTGMYMRLAFSVAAHLEPDILIVDEVLAVGDVEFQTKCLNKMKEASQVQGRTILFVSHDAQAVANLCNKAIWLKEGEVKEIGETKTVVGNYLTSVRKGENFQIWHNEGIAPRTASIKLKSIAIAAQGKSPNQIITVHDPIAIQIDLACLKEGFNLEICLTLLTEDGICVFDLGSPTLKAEVREFTYVMLIPGNLLNDNCYIISLRILKNNAHTIFEVENCATFEVQDLREGLTYFGEWSGIIRPDVKVEFAAKKGCKEIT
jgi:lipopolysaccharide transport system ATP-binding protein